MAHANSMTCNEELIHIFAANRIVAVSYSLQMHTLSTWLIQATEAPEGNAAHSQSVCCCLCLMQLACIRKRHKPAGTVPVNRLDAKLILFMTTASVRAASRAAAAVSDTSDVAGIVPFS